MLSLSHKTGLASLLLLASLALGLTSCERREKPSVLIIAVDSLPFHLSLCGRDPDSGRSGFQRLCQESIRFTHAITPSTLSVPALTSILTGLYPYQHGVRHNGGTGLSPQIRTFAEAAIDKGYRTALFSGGPPMWRKTGLHQGFEVFDDNINFSTGRLFRSFEENLRLFESWLHQEVGHDPFLSLLYIPDLNFTDTITESSTGEMRSLSFESQIEELDESLDDLLISLKKTERWDDTWIVLVGLNGREISPRHGEIEPLLLHSENTQVTLLVKPPAKPRDLALQWTIDRNVSLTDLGPTIFEILGEKVVSLDEDFPIFSLMSSLRSAQPTWPEERPLILESGWAAWQGWGPVRAGILQEFDLTLFESKPRVFNTLTDRLETSPFPASRANPALLAKLRERGFEAWSGLPAEKLAPLTVPSLDWMSSARNPMLLAQLRNFLSEKTPDERVLRWAAELAIEQKDWNLLLSAATKAKQPLWKTIAEKNLGQRVTLEDPCLSLLSLKSADPKDVKRCNDDGFLSLLGWIQADLVGDHRDVAKRRFLRSWENWQMDLRLFKINAGMGLLWLPASAETPIPSLSALALALPELKRFNP